MPRPRAVEEGGVVGLVPGGAGEEEEEEEVDPRTVTTPVKAMATLEEGAVATLTLDPVVGVVDTVEEGEGVVAMEHPNKAMGKFTVIKINEVTIV